MHSFDKYRKLSVALLLMARVVVAADAKPSETPSPRDPAGKTAQAAIITAKANEQKAQTERLIAIADAELARAQAAYQWARVRYLEDQRRILKKEYEEILRQQFKFQYEINSLESKLGQIQFIRSGLVMDHSLDALNDIIASADDTEPVFQAMEQKIDRLPASNFKPDRYQGNSGRVTDFAGGNIWDLINFALDNKLMLARFRPAHIAVSRAVSTVVKIVYQQIMRREQAIQAARAARLSEVFQHPPQ